MPFFIQKKTLEGTQFLKSQYRTGQIQRGMNHKINLLKKETSYTVSCKLWNMRVKKFCIPSTSTAALATRPTPAVSSAARHFSLSRNERKSLVLNTNCALQLRLLLLAPQHVFIAKESESGCYPPYTCSHINHWRWCCRVQSCCPKESFSDMEKERNL